MNKKTLISTLAGNLMEFYDFTIYAFMAPQIGSLFFPHADKSVSIILTFLVFAGGYLTRPVGAVFYGYVGDRIGRKNALLMSISMITLATFLMSLLPTCGTVGIIAPAILTLLRLLQGFSVSGEEGGAAVFMFEWNRFQGQGKLGSFVLSSVLMGVLVGSIVCLLISHFVSHEDLYSWGWRIPFVLALPIGVTAYILRLNISDSQLFTEAKKGHKLHKHPTWSLLTKHKSHLIFGTLSLST